MSTCEQGQKAVRREPECCNESSTSLGNLTPLEGSMESSRGPLAAARSATHD